jgi:hypothetical protein
MTHRVQTRASVVPETVRKWSDAHGETESKTFK